MKKENNIDQLFKKGMEDPEIPYNELDWQKMAEKLDASEARRRTPLWMYAGAGIAAALLVMMFLFLSKENPKLEKKNTNVSTKAKAPGVNGTLRSTRQRFFAPQQQSSSTTTHASRDGSSAYTDAIAPMLINVLPPPSLFNGKSNNQEQQIALALTRSNTPTDTLMREAMAQESKPKSSKLTLTILAAPDVTDSKTSIGTKISSNFGLLLTYPVSKKLSISTGALYARKLYDYGGNATTLYGQADGRWALNADCFVIDVPINVNYQVLHKKNYSVTLNSGLSSYIMLKEKYKYTSTDQTGIPQITRLELNNQNQHPLGIVNLSVSVERQVSDRVSIGVQPFLKLPLTGIGYYNYNLRSRGVAVSLSIKPFGSKN
jgi:hypothetical protein